MFISNNKKLFTFDASLASKIKKSTWRKHPLLPLKKPSIITTILFKKSLGHKRTLASKEENAMSSNQFYSSQTKSFSLPFKLSLFHQNLFYETNS